MPFRKWAVEPVFLSRKPLPPDKKCYGSEFIAVTNGTLVQCLMQLSSVAKIADRIFDEIGSEFRLVAERAERLKVKVEVCQDIVSKLNARAVKVPVSDLCETSKFLRHQQPYTPAQELQTQFFLPSNRPPIIDDLYQKASATPVSLICNMDRYRVDGLTSSQVFMVTPVLGGGGRKRARKHLDIETRKPANFSLARDQQDEDMYDLSSYSALVPPSIGGNLRQNASRELERLPSPEELALCTSLEYPSMVVPVDTSGSTFNRMSLFRRSLLHVDFVIKRKKDKRKSKRRHTVCEGDSREIEKAIRDISVAHSSCQTDDIFDVSSSTTTTIHRSLSKRRSRSTMDNSRRKSSDFELDLLKQDCKDSNENIKDQSKKSKLAAIKSRACNFNPLSSISAAITMAAVKMRQSTRTGKQDDGRSSSGNWSASSSTRASVDSDHHHATTPVDRISTPSRNSAGKDSLLSDITHQDQHNRSRDDIPVQPLSKSPTKQKKYTPINPPWAFDPGSSDTHTQEHSALHTPTIRSPYAGRKGTVDDGDSSVYSVDTDGYYTSMHTDSGLWCNVLDNLPKPNELNGEGYRLRQESQSSVSTIGNSSINSFLSNKSATECSSSNSSLKRRSVIPLPPPRVSSCNQIKDEDATSADKQGGGSASEQSDSPQPHNGSESDFDVGDRIRVKTAITPFRYPSMCAVSPETSDDEIGEWKNSNVVVAEVHREEDNQVRRDSPQQVPITDNQRLNNRVINMYRSETPVQSSFSSKIPHSSQVTTSTPRSGIAISTFSPDLQDFSDTSTNKTGSSEDLKSIDDGLIVTEKPVSPLNIGSVPDKSLIPLKYAQHITVTPIARSNASGKSDLSTSRCLSELSNSSSEQSPRKSGNNSSSYVSYKSPDSPVSNPSHIIKPYNSVPSSPTGSLSRPVARVTLDPTGKVVFSSNSLERTGSVRHNTKPLQERGYSTLPTYQSSVMESGFMSSSQIPVPKTPSTSTNMQNETISNRYSDSKSTPLTIPTSPATEHSIMNTKAIPSAQNTFATNSVLNRAVATSASKPILSSSPTNTVTVGGNPNSSSLPYPTSSRDFNFRPSRGGRLCRSYFPSHLISQSNNSDGSNLNNPERAYTPLTNLFRPKQYSSTPMHASPQVPSYHKNPSSLNQRFNTLTSVVPNKPYSSIPLYKGNQTGNGDSAYSSAKINHSTPENAYSHRGTNSYFHTHNTNSFMSKPPDLIPSGASPPSTLDITSNQNKRASLDGELKLMSATELFAIIHNSKKKHNIKTESEMSMSPMSSRSVSPASSHCSLPSKLQPIETGDLSKRAKPCDRTNWYNSMPSRRPLASNNKITNVKPTSMRDFKMLLLQARTGGGENSPRPSAAELLKVSPPKTPGLSPTSRTILTPSPVKSSPSYMNQNSFLPGLVSVKRNRARSPFLARYDNAYPPILEDCSEELESNHQENKCLGSQGAQSKQKPSIPVSGQVAKATSTWV